LTYLAVKRSRVPILAGVGSATLDISLDLAREARDAGASAVLLPPPLCPRYEQDDLREFYLEFSRQLGSGIAVFVSAQAGASSEITPAAAIDLLSTGRFAGIEEGRDDLDGFLRMKDAAQGSSWQVLQGSDALFTRARCAGGCCAISAAACAVPELLMALDRAISTRRSEQVERLDGELRKFLEWASRFPPPLAVRVATGLRGLKTGPVVMTLSSAKQKLLDEFRTWFQAWSPGLKRLCASG
jgi:4-hydroxy-tetrahydrodipicolinate synthase